jgi:MscS family membrane protein
MEFRTSRVVAAIRLSCFCVLVLLAGDFVVLAQTTSQAPGPEPTKTETAKDPLGRDTPRGTVLGFLNAARKNEWQLAREYLDTRLTGHPGELLARQLFEVLDARLPPRLTKLNDAKEGSRLNPLAPDQEVVGTVESAQGNVDVVLRRLQRETAPPIWLFSSATLDSIPPVYEEIAAIRGETPRYRFLAGARTSRVLLFEWFTVLIGIAAFYILTVLLNRLLSVVVARLRARVTGIAPATTRDLLPIPARLLVLALVGRWVLSHVSLSLLVRQFWSTAAQTLTLAAIVWLLVVLNGEVEQYILRRLPRASAHAGPALLRLARRAADILVIFIGLLAALRLFAVDVTPALAGLGVGGIAVALAAQKTLENVIAGASLVFDQAVRVGDFLKMGDVMGTVDHIGLRSTRIRTLDRTVVSIPNGQIANASVETLSARDKFWFHPAVGLRYETTPEQLHAVVDGIRRMLEEHHLIDRDSIRVRFFRLGAFSLDVDVFAYVFARDLNQFLEIQETLLFGITEIVADAGTGIAFPSQTMYVEDAVAPVAQSLRTKR